MDNIFDDDPVDAIGERELRLRELVQAWDRYREAGDPVSAAFVLTDFSNQMTHLRWQLEYEEERVEREIFEAHSSPERESAEVVVANYRVAWSQEDCEFVATADEYPSLSWVAPTPHEALEGIIELVEEIAAEHSGSGGHSVPAASGANGEQPGKPNRILWNRRPNNSDTEGGDIDEIVCRDVTVHVEQMDERCWWIGVYGVGGQSWSGHFTADKNGKLRFSQQNSEWVWDLDQSHNKEE